jgi:nitroreductase
MEVFKAIQKRHSVRSYLSDKVPIEKLMKSLEAARSAYLLSTLCLLS